MLAALEATYGAGGFALVEVDASGAPLTYKRSLEDWYAAGELRADLVDQTRTALAADAEARLEGIIWVQGEGDTHAIARAGEYTARLESLMESFRAAIALDLAGRDTGAE
ncbi:MAG: hypothetical protein KC910_22350, partial [Candidatus Eremiobacteraeota bacterium]|nr:hypothetical protein [Candidatus Eremiobacteraeota bacterium]